MAVAVVSPAAYNSVAGNTELPRVASVDMAGLQFDGVEQSEWMNKTVRVSEEEEE